CLRGIAAITLQDRIGVRKEEYLQVRDRLILGHLRLCAQAIKHFRLKGKCLYLEWVDLIQEGVFGLARAIDRFDPNQGTEFSTYAFPWIRQAITRAIENHDRLIRIPAQCWHGEARLSDGEWGRFNRILSLSSHQAGVVDQISDLREDEPPMRLIQQEFRPS